MRKVLLIALGLASLGAIASVQPAAAKVTCQTVCEVFSTDSAGHGTCTRSRQKCTGTDDIGSRAVQPIQQQKLKRQS